MPHDTTHPAVAPISGWFAGPKAENGDWFAGIISRIVSDYHAWRRNYFPEDGVVVDSAGRRDAEPFRDRFEDRLIELLARLKEDVPFYSPRHAGHMISEQTLPSIAAYFAAMLYNPNNVSADAAPVTVRLELEACRMIARMLGHPEGGWAHLTSGGTIAGIEALWIARMVKYLPLAVAEARLALKLECPDDPRSPAGRRRLLAMNPGFAMRMYTGLFDDAAGAFGPGPQTVSRVQKALLESRFHVPSRGLASVIGALDSSPVVLAPETHHYGFDKAMDLLGLGGDALVRVRVDAHFRMRTDELEARLDEVERSGRHALAVVAVIGTTEEGAIDPIDRILSLRAARESAANQSFWIHADAAYGGYLRTLTLPVRSGLGPRETMVKIAGTVRQIAIDLPQHHACDALEHLGECDSITVDPHKLGYVPYPAGCISFRSDIVKPLARQNAPYIAEHPSDPDADRRSDAIGIYILEGSKPGAAAAAVWLSHTLIPLDASGHGALVSQTIRNACELHALLESYPKLLRDAGRPAPPVRAVSLCPPGSNIVCYAFAPAAGSEPTPLATLNAANAAVYQRFAAESGRRVYDQSFFVSRTTLSADRYNAQSVQDFLQRLAAPPDEFSSDGVFLLRSVLMNPWLEQAKSRNRCFLSELVAELYTAAAVAFG